MPAAAEEQPPAELEVKTQTQQKQAPPAQKEPEPAKKEPEPAKKEPAKKEPEPAKKEPEPAKKEPAKPAEEAVKKDAAPAPKQQAPPPKKDEPKKPEPPAEKKEEPKPTTPSIVVDEDKKDTGNPGHRNQGKHGNPREHSSSPEDTVVNGDSRKGKDKGRPTPKGKQKAYAKAPTTILEEGKCQGLFAATCSIDFRVVAS